MGYVYEWRFYHPQQMPSVSQVINTLEAWIQGGARVIRYQDLSTRSSIIPKTPVPASQLITTNGQTAVHLSFALPTGRAQVFFQVFSPEDSGPFASLSMDEDIFKANAQTAPALFLNLGLQAALYLPVYFAWVDHTLALQKLEPALDLTRIKALAWANLFSRPLVDCLSLDVLKQAPGYQVQDFQQGFLYLLAPTPLEPPRPETLSYLRQVLPGAVISQW